MSTDGVEPGAWVHDDGALVALRCRLWGYNAIGLVSEGEACAVDPGIAPAEIEALRARLERDGARVTTVVVTHSHHDHIRGWDAFPGATVVMPRVAANKADGPRKRILAGKAKVDERLGVDGAGFRYPEADVRFDERHVARIGALDVELRFLPGHSNCCAVVVVRALGALLSGDYLVTPGLPYCRWEARAFERAHEAMLRWLDEDGIDLVVPAHNAVLAGRERAREALRGELAYFEALRAEVRRRIEAGEGDEAVARGAAARMGEWRGVDLGRRAIQDLDNARRVLAEERRGTEGGRAPRAPSSG